ncbi:MAG: Fe-S cluster assembly protein IscX [Chloroflexota bacterium]|nr:Fe-S cluster assembly protein IscX [Chloroflexota bacterium]
MTLTWEGDYAIALALIETHPDVDLDTVGLDQLYRWIIMLPDFADDPALANESILKGILREWYEEIGSQ